MTKENRIKSLFETDPVLLKPTQLGLYPRVWNYFGYLPDLGTSYGTFKCSHDEHSGVITSKFQEPYCPECGKGMEASSMNLEVGDYDTIFTAKNAFNIVPKCSACSVEILSNVDVVNGHTNTFYCVGCGSDIINDYKKYVDLFKIKDPATKKQFTNYVDDLETNSNSEVMSMNKTKTEATYEILSYNQFTNTTKISPENAVMRCYAQQTDNPYWNIEVEGMPVGRIYLKDQVQGGVQLEKIFTTDYYAAAIIKNFSNVGLIPTLKKVNAKIWKAKVDETNFHKKVKAEVTTRLEKEYNEKRKNLQVKAGNIKGEMLDCVALASVGIHKNFWNIENPLKAELLEEMHRHGITPNVGANIIETSFDKAEMEHYTVIIDKAIALLSMSDEALAEIANVLLEADTMDVDLNGVDSMEDDEEIAGKGTKLSDELTFPMPDTMAGRMANSNVHFTAQAGVSQQPVAKSAKKEAIRKSLNFTYRR